VCVFFRVFYDVCVFEDFVMCVLCVCVFLRIL